MGIHEFHAERSALEALVRNHPLEFIRGAPLHSLGVMSSLARSMRALQRYWYVDALDLHDPDDQALQHALHDIFAAYASKAREAVTVLRGYLPSCAAETGLIQQLSRDLAVLSSDDAYAFAEQERTIRAVFSRQHNLAEPDMLRELGRVRSMLIDIGSAARRTDSARARACELASYVVRASQALRLDVIEHAGVAARTFPQRRDVGSLEARDLTYRYLAACEQAERELRLIERTAQGVGRATVGLLPASPPAEILIGARSHHASSELARILQPYGEIERFRLIPYLALRTDEGHARTLLQDAASVLRGSRAKEAIIYAARSYQVAPMRAATLEEEWNLELIAAPAAWRTTRGEGAAVAIIDTGVDYTHPDLAERFSGERGIDIISGGEPYDDNGHGTHVAGTVAGKRTGVAPDATLYAVKVLDAGGYGSEISVLKGIEWAIEHGVHVINMSLGSSSASKAEADLVAIANERGIAVCCAAGNDGDGSYNYPASYPGAISVAAVDQRKAHAPFSNSNDRVAIAAPGVSVYSTWPGGSYDSLSGTSMATPHIAGACALLTSINKLDYRAVLQRTAERLGDQEQFGAGLVRLAEAVK